MSEILAQHLVSFAVEGKELPVNLSSFQELSIVENVSVKLPTLKFVYSDTQDALINNPLVDDAKITIVLHSANYNDPEQPIEFTFRCKGAEYKPSGNSMVVRAAGIFDRMQYLRKIQKMPVEGNSNEGIKKVLQENGFGKFNIDSANDKMWWRPKGSMMFVESFVRHMATHGMVDKKSVMSVGVSADGTAHYKNVAKLAEQSASRKFTEIDRLNRDNGDIPLIQYSIKSLGGLTNSMNGYGAQVLQEKLAGTSDKITDAIVPMLGGALNMNDSVKGLVGDVMRTFAPIDLGNQHEKFYQAKEQNIRGLQQLQSTTVEVTTSQATGLKIYDVVGFEPHLPSNNQLFELVAGSYIVTSKTRYFAGARFYREKFTLNRSGMGNQKGQTGYKP